MEDDKVLAGLAQLHDDVKELTRVIAANYDGVKNQNVQMKRLYVTVIVVAFVAYFVYPWFTHFLR